MNIDINENVAVCFNPAGEPVDCYGEVIPHKLGEKLKVSHELGASLRRAQKLIKPENLPEIP
jgi:hypothetical protein